MKCTWTECNNIAENKMIAQDGEVWADLCHTHEKEFERVSDSGNVKKLMGAWVKAMGGARKATDRMTSD